MNFLFRVLISTFLTLISTRASAHVRWFVDSNNIPDVSFPFDGLILFVTAGGLAYIALCVVINTLSQRNAFCAPYIVKPLKVPYNLDWYLLIGLLNLLLVISLMKGEVFAPNLTLPANSMMFGVILQASALILVSFSVALTGVALCLIALLLPVIFSAPMAMDYFFEILFVGFAYLSIAPKVSRFDREIYHKLDITAISAYAPVLIRVGLGLQLLTLGLRNKLFEPGATMMFLDAYPHYNFMKLMGFEAFEHIYFVYSAGLFEVVFGLMLVVGLGVRFVGLTLVFVFASTALVSGMEEVTGHLPIFAILAIILANPRELKWASKR